MEVAPWAQTNVDVKVAVKGEGDLDKLLKRMNALEKEVNQLNGKLPKQLMQSRQQGVQLSQQRLVSVD